jgi:hypothetical protein
VIAIVDSELMTIKKSSEFGMTDRDEFGMAIAVPVGTKLKGAGQQTR